MSDKNDSDIKVYIGVATLGVVTVALLWLTVWLVIESERDKDLEQRKQDACLKAGGMWIDNRHTDSYCFFNK